MSVKELPNKVADLRKILVEEHGFNTDTVQGLNRKQLKELIESKISADKLFDQANPVTDTIEEIVTETTEKQQKVYKPSDVDWTDHVLSMLEGEAEIDNGKPKVDGLRRVAYKLYGPFDVHVDVEQVPTTDNGGRATVKCTLTFGNEWGGRRTVSGAADVFPGNTDGVFAKFPVATAESRAEGRALRKALYLTKVVTAEEVTSTSDIMNQPASDSLKNAILTAASRRNINVGSLIPSIDDKKVNLDELTTQQANTLLAMINNQGNK